MKRVAIITRTKNRNLLLKRCLESVARQTVHDWLHVIVNDGGNQTEVEELVKAYQINKPDQYLVLHRQESQGMEAASNFGIRNSSSELVTLLDDDDTWSPEFLEESLKAIFEVRLATDSMVRGVACHSLRVREVIKEDLVLETAREDFNSDLRTIRLYDLVKGNRFTINSFIYFRSALDVVGFYNESLPVLGDWEFNLRFLKHFDILILNKPLAFFHVRDVRQVGAYANTVTAGIDLHLHYRTVIENQLLREDLSKGTFGLGSLMFLGTGFMENTATMNRETRILRPFNKLTKWIKSN